MPRIIDVSRDIAWEVVGSVRPTDLHDARLQLHQAAQVCVAAAISYLHPEPDDSHTAFTWSDSHDALTTTRIIADRTFRAALQVGRLTLLILDDDDAIRSRFELSGRTIAEAYDWLREQVRAAGLDAPRLTSRKHYEIPTHAVAGEAPFALGDGGAFEELRRWYANAAHVLAEITTSRRDASPIRCWPHHFDLATLLALPPASGQSRTIGVGLSPGDDSYDEPYFYAGPYPYPPTSLLPPLAIGVWHTAGWTAAVLRASDVVAERDQGGTVTAFAVAAIEACRKAMHA
jgi:hypothetical protein